ncbi:MAG: hypothetical protein M1832_001423 [Thelocarpon impressellum]|nr:MAG: hypothetical protein M1832_001423 [Thelocarpon impressellum]
MSANPVSGVTSAVGDAVNNITTALGSATIADKAEAPAASETAPAGDAAASTAATTEAAAASAAEGRRLYIGNLAYAATEADLKEFFKGYLV